MIALAFLNHLPIRILAAVSIAIIVLHNLLDGVHAGRFWSGAWFWDILHQQNLFSWTGVNFLTAYPVLPRIGVMATGYCLGTVFGWNAERRQHFLLRLGLALIVAFVGLRAINIYGDPVSWTHPAPHCSRFCHS
jgi:uncharacterized membrane protein